MVSQGPNNPGTMTDDSSVGTIIWSDVNNAKLNDGNYTSVLLTSTNPNSHYLKATNFGFNIPIGSTIDGIFVEIDKKKGGLGSAKDLALYIIKSDGSLGSENKADLVNLWNLSDTITTYGLSSDLWSEIWANTDINDVDFGVVFQAQRVSGSGTMGAFVDFIRITVYYTEPTPVTRPFAVNTGSQIGDTTQVYDIAIGNTAHDYSNYGGVTWYGGPDETNGYLIVRPVNNQPRYWRTVGKTDDAFIKLVNSVKGTNPPYTTVVECLTWISNNEFYTDYPV